MPNPVRLWRHVAVLSLCRDRDPTKKALNRLHLLGQKAKCKCTEHLVFIGMET
jgi:hypothetical protein